MDCNRGAGISNIEQGIMNVEGEWGSRTLVLISCFQLKSSTNNRIYV